MEIPLTIVDFVVLGILLISGLIATYRGLIKEALSVGSWLAAALGAVFCWPVAKPFARSLVEPQLLADILGLVGVFLILLIPISFVSFRLQELVRGTHAGPLDRSLGFVFGAARGLLVVGLGYLVFSALAPTKDHPDWVREARLLPVIKGTADVIRSFGGNKKKADKEQETADASDGTPQEAKEETKEETKHAEIGGAKPETKAKPARPVENTENEGSGDKSKSYDAGDRRAMDQLVRSTTKP